MTDETTYTADEVATHRAAWLAALRSGDYAQGHGALRVDAEDGTPRYCCLGVAEDVRGATWHVQPTHDADGEPLDVLAHGGSHQVDDVDGVPQGIVLSQATMRWLGVVVSNPFVVVEDDDGDDGDDGWTVTQLSDLNDDHHLTLAQIADVVTDQPASWTGDEREALAELNHRAD